MYYRTRTYLAGDWDHDKDVVEQLRKWNDSNKWSIDFTDAHDLMSARDGSLNCSIKDSLRKRMLHSKRFVLVVSRTTKTLTAGSCQYCKSYDAFNGYCHRGYSFSFDSYIEYECKKALEMGLKIIVIHKGASVIRSHCPKVIQYAGIHVSAYANYFGEWNYAEIRDAFRATE